MKFNIFILLAVLLVQILFVRSSPIDNEQKEDLSVDVLRRKRSLFSFVGKCPDGTTYFPSCGCISCKIYKDITGSECPS